LKKDEEDASPELAALVGLFKDKSTKAYVAQLQFTDAAAKKLGEILAESGFLLATKLLSEGLMFASRDAEGELLPVKAHVVITESTL